MPDPSMQDEIRIALLEQDMQRTRDAVNELKGSMNTLVLGLGEIKTILAQQNGAQTALKDNTARNLSLVANGIALLGLAIQLFAGGHIHVTP